VWPEGLCQWKIPMTPSRIDPATFRFVAQCLNHYATACPSFARNWGKTSNEVLNGTIELSTTGWWQSPRVCRTLFVESVFVSARAVHALSTLTWRSTVYAVGALQFPCFFPSD
jgi:hypothetical protein